MVPATARQTGPSTVALLLFEWLQVFRDGPEVFEPWLIGDEVATRGTVHALRSIGAQISLSVRSQAE